MTPLWKRSKVNQISQLVADLKSPPKRSGSLVIQTGFPNSLIDLFVKNHNRLKHPSKKKRHKPQVNPPPSPPPTLPSFFSKKDDPKCSLRLEIGKIAPEESELSKFGRKEEIRGTPDLIGVCLSVFKVAFVVIIAFCTKKLILGITLAAFSLLLVEYLGDQVLWFFKPCEKVGQRFRSFLSWAEYIYLGKKRGKMEFNENGLPRGEVRELKDDNSIVSDLSCYFVEQDQEARDRTVDEIELVESNFCIGGGMNEITPRVGIITDKEANKMADEEIERASEVCRSGKGNTGKFWKKYLPKKLQRKNKNLGRSFTLQSLIYQNGRRRGTHETTTYY
ncbi:hypothetical protein Nepgr_022661 [Nepenthes gracilis]|uniref:Uncharacterized protein n=1 Tax=Nepenthes gracilis TaxID=150966 RepID=A0AAD3XYA8_NEPGR|nr:hypothetical protein Nepgr_022661 [Nepenthes gracilis]